MGRSGASKRPSRDLDLFGSLPNEADFSEPPATRPLAVYEELGETFPGATARSAVGVGALTQTAKDIVEGAFMPLWVRGEVTGFKAHRSGHWYFCLRDADAQIRCVVWSRDRRGIPAAPDEGMQVTAFGQLTVYAARGEMQFAVRRLEAAGDGLWRKALEITRSKLEADGLLAPERKRPLPRHPRVIAVVTSPDGAALHDIAAVIRRRAPYVRLVVIAAAVQGESAPEELCFALDQVGRWGLADAVIIGRGGGGREDLWAFNDERVARALARCPVPTISAIGHEIDITICDLVADLRAPTPSAAAESAVRDSDDLAAELQAQSRRLLSAMAGRIVNADNSLRGAASRLSTAGRLGIERRRAALGAAAGRLNALSPLATLARGYTIAQSPTDGSTLASVAQFRTDMEFDLLLRDGVVHSTARRVQASTATEEPESEP
jgi:exodeoxyribonuclease VII large subunit